MAKDRYDFISEILENKKLNPLQEKRVLSLFAQEIKNDKTEGKDLELRITRIEELLKLKSSLTTHKEVSVTNTDVDKAAPPSDSLPNYINPNNLSRFLQAYNQNPILKTTCHEVDEDELENLYAITGEAIYSFKNHYQLIIIAFEELQKEYPNINYKVLGLIKGYLTGKSKEPIFGGWSSKNIKINWDSKELQNWSLINPGIPPNPDETLSEHHSNVGFEFDEIKNLNIKSFSEVVIYFKKLFHIRNDNSLKQIILHNNEKKNWNNKIEFEIADDSFRSNIEFFTYVDALVQAYDRIINIILEAALIQEKLQKPKVKLLFYEENKTIVFSIIHLNATFSKTSNNLIDRIGKKHRFLIINQVNGLCEMYIKGDFRNGEYAEINLWNGEERKAKKITKFIGVEHKLVFTK